MANSVCLSKRLALAVLPMRNPAIVSPFRHPHPKDWIRTITSSSARRSRGVTFGKENDGLIAPYLQRPTKTSRLGRKQRVEVAPLDAREEYEIGGFVDRSSPATNLSDDMPEAFDENLADFEKPRKGRKSVNREDDGRETVRKRAGEHDAKYPRQNLTNEKDSMSERPQLRRVDRNREDNGRERINNREGQYPKRSRPGPPNVRGTLPEQSQLRRISRTREDDSTASLPRVSQPLKKREPEDVESWATQKNALKEKFEDGWNPRKKLSPDAMEGIRGLHEQDPDKYSTELLAQQFKVSPEAIRRILKSKWAAKQSPEMLQVRKERWAKRHDRIWDAKAEIGQRPPRRKSKEVEDPDQFERDLERRRILGEI